MTSPLVYNTNSTTGLLNCMSLIYHSTYYMFEDYLII